MTYREREIKLQIQDLDSMTLKLHDLGAIVKTPRHFEDNLLYDTPDASLRQSGRLLRLRLIDGRGILTFKGKGKISDGVKDREEIECAVEPAAKVRQMLQELGYSVSFRYQKYRTVYEISGMSGEILLDETPIGNYLEVEGDIATIHEIAQKLGFERDTYITESYASLYFNWCKVQGHTPSHMTFS